MILVKEFLNRLKLDFSNIEKVYSDSLNEYNVNNIDKTEVIFIDSFDFDGIQQSENLSKLSEYLEKKRNKVEWHNIDFYNHYIKTGRFIFSMTTPIYKNNEYKKAKETLKEYKKRYDYILNRLAEDEKNEFKWDFYRKLERLKEKQTIDKFIEIIDDLQKTIKEEYLIFKEDKEHQRIDKVEKTLFDFIFKIDDKKAFLNELKNIFPTEKGINIKAMLEILIENEVLVIGTKEFKKFYSELKNHFKRNIGTYASINDVKIIDNQVKDPIKIKLNPLIVKYKAT